MNLRKDFERLKYDNRMVDINLKAGLVTKKDLEERKQKLEDLKDRATQVELKAERRPIEED